MFTTPDTHNVSAHSESTPGSKSGRSAFSLVLFAVSCALLLAACGGNDVAADPQSAASIEAAESNIGQLDTSGPLSSIEVLDVSTGEVATLGQTFDGDRPVLLWFFSPH